MINKQDEKKKILGMLWHGNGLSRRDINAVLKIRPTTLQEIISEMLEENLLHEPERTSVKTGARSPLLYINPGYGNLLGVDIGSTRVKVVITDFNGTVLYKIKGAYEQGKNRDGVWAEVFSIFKNIRRTVPKLWNKIIGIGVADPGPVDAARGVSLFAFNIKNWENICTAEIFLKKYHWPVSLLTASQAKAVYEYFFASEAVHSLFLVDMSNGIGAAFIHEGKLFTGSSHTEMELGHITVNYDGRQCVCGKKGCLESEIGTAAIVDKFKRKIEDGALSILKTTEVQIPLINGIYESSLKGDPVSLSLVYETAEYLARGLSCVIQLLNPRQIIIHGSITILKDKITDCIKHSLRKYSFPRVVDDTKIICSVADEFSAATGACLAIRGDLLSGTTLKSSGIDNKATAAGR